MNIQSLALLVLKIATISNQSFPARSVTGANYGPFWNMLETKENERGLFTDCAWNKDGLDVVLVQATFFSSSTVSRLVNEGGPGE